MIRTISTFRRLVKAFEAGCILPRDWNHQTRLILGLWYVLNPAKDGPIEAMHRGIIACEARLHGTQARHWFDQEAVTAFYLEKIRAFAAAASPDLGLVGLASALLTSKLVDPRLHFGLFHSGFQPSEGILSTLSEFDLHDGQPIALSA